MAAVIVRTGNRPGQWRDDGPRRALLTAWLGGLRVGDALPPRDVVLVVTGTTPHPERCARGHPGPWKRTPWWTCSECVRILDRERKARARRAAGIRERGNGCPRGHDASHLGLDIRGRRICRECMRDATRRWRKRAA